MLVKEQILKAVGDLRSEVTDKLNELKAPEETIEQLNECANRMGHDDTPISTMEDDCCTLNVQVEELEQTNKTLEHKLVKMETTSCLNNVCLVNVPEGADSPDPCGSPELASTHSGLTAESAHSDGAGAPPQTKKRHRRPTKTPDHEVCEAPAEGRHDGSCQKQQGCLVQEHSCVV